MRKTFYSPSEGRTWTVNAEPMEHHLARYPVDTVEIPVNPGGGHTWSGSQWVAPPPATDQELREAVAPLTARQFKLGLVRNGISLAQIDALLTTDEQRIEWNYATQFERLHPLIISLAPALGLDPATIDGMWAAAMDY